MSIKTARMRRTVLSIMEDYSLFSLVCWGNDSEMWGAYRGKAYVQGGGYRSRTALYLRQNRWYAMPHRPLNTMVTPFRFGFSYAKIVYYLLGSCRLYKKRPSSWWCPLIFFGFLSSKQKKEALPYVLQMSFLVWYWRKSRRKSAEYGKVCNFFSSFG